MKKVFMTMAVLTGLVAGGIVFSSFTTPQQERANGVLEFKVNNPIYWQGRAVKYNGSLEASSWVELNHSGLQVQRFLRYHGNEISYSNIHEASPLGRSR